MGLEGLFKANFDCTVSIILANLGTMLPHVVLRDVISTSGEREISTFSESPFKSN